MTTTKSISEMLIDEIMTRNVDMLSPSDSIQNAVKLMLDGRITTLPVVGPEGQCVGILSHSDLTEFFLNEDSQLTEAMDVGTLSMDWLARSIETSDVSQVNELMTHEVTTIRSDKTVADACREMVRLKVHHLPVVDQQDKVVGIVSTFDVVTAIASA